jgi:uncharacterized protein YndB with AHSA1/START domain
MVWLLAPIAVIVLAVAVVVVVGLCLPQDHVASRAVKVRAAPEAVFPVLTDLAAFPTWRPDVKKVDVLPSEGTKRLWREETDFGPIKIRELEVEAPRKLVTEIADPDLPFAGTWTYELAPQAGGGTRVKITERGSVKNPVFRFLSRFVMGQTKTMDVYLTALAKKLGDNAAPEPGE